MSRIALALLLVLATLLAACGDDEGGGSGGSDADADVVAAPEPSESIEDTFEPLNAAIADGDCEAVAALTHSALRPEQGDPEAPASPEECDFIEPLLQDLKGAEFTEGEEFGTGGVTQSEAPPKFAKDGEVVSFVWLLDSDGAWRQISFFIGDAQIGTEPAGEALPTAEDFLAAAQEEDCKAMVPTLNEDGTLVFQAEGDATEGCKLLTGGRIFAPAVAETPDPQLEDFGGTLDNTFVGLATKDEYFTIVLGTPNSDPDDPQPTDMLVSDVRPNTLTAEDVAALDEEK